MDVVIANGRRIVPDAVRALVEEKVGRLGRYCPGLERAEVRFSEEHNPRIVDRELCEVIMSGHGRVIRARAAAPEALAAVDRVAEKLEHQLEKTKGLLINSHRGRRSSVPARALQRPRVRTA
ncbi:MAG TPA: ribosome-associated translation inhibitor RaiA [Acidimicrobiales bacterium]|nr:ribosome-associated translation inhibitor RaiA [Acidimicrobiales bacterium]